MSQIRFYLDEDSVEKSLITAFRNAGLDVVTVTDVDRQSYSDEEQLIWATEQERVIYSYNRRDFCRLHNEFLATERSHAGIILLQQQRYSIGQQLRGLLQLVSTLSAEEMVNQLVFLIAYIERVWIGGFIEWNVEGSFSQYLLSLRFPFQLQATVVWVNFLCM